jgi:arginase
MPPMQRSVHILGAPLDLGSGRRGVDMGPSAIRLTQLGQRLEALGHRVEDHGNVEVAVAEATSFGDPHARYVREVAATCGQIFERVWSTVQAGAIPVTLGGDHSIAAGSVAAVAAVHRGRQKPIGLLWIDAHTDMNTPETSPSGNVHGMPLAALLGLGPAALAELGGLGAKVSPRNVALLGIRSIDDSEKAIVRSAGVHVFTMADIDRRGISTVLQEALAHVLDGTAGVHVSLDVDGLDPEIAPGVGTPVRGGLSYRESHLAMEMVAESGKLLGFDLVEVNPILDTHNATAELGCELVLSAFGKRIL